MRPIGVQSSMSLSLCYSVPNLSATEQASKQNAKILLQLWAVRMASYCERFVFPNVNLSPCNHSAPAPAALVCISFEIKRYKLQANSDMKNNTGLVCFLVPIFEIQKRPHSIILTHLFSKETRCCFLWFFFLFCFSFGTVTLNQVPVSNV